METLYEPWFWILVAAIVVALYFGILKYRKWENLRQGKALEARFRKEKEKQGEAKGKLPRDQILKRIIAAREARENRQQALLSTQSPSPSSPQRELSTATS